MKFLNYSAQACPLQCTLALSLASWDLLARLFQPFPSSTGLHQNSFSTRSVVAGEEYFKRGVAMGIPATSGVLSIAMASLFFTLASYPQEAATCEEPVVLVREGDLCWNSATLDDCVGAAGEACVWCDLPQRCFPASHDAQGLSAASCFSSTRKLQSRRQLLDSNECGSIAGKGLCSRVDYCRWCRSEFLDDSCFGAAEAARLPRSIFDCFVVS